MDPSVACSVGHTLIDPSLLILHVCWAPRAPPALPLTLWVLMAPGLSQGGNEKGHLENRECIQSSHCMLFKVSPSSMPNSRWVIENDSLNYWKSVFLHFYRFYVLGFRRWLGNLNKTKLWSTFTASSFPLISSMQIHCASTKLSRGIAVPDQGCTPDMLGCPKGRTRRLLSSSPGDLLLSHFSCVRPCVIP